MKANPEEMISDFFFLV